MKSKTLDLKKDELDFLSVNFYWKIDCLPNFFTGRNFSKTDGASDVSESRVKCVRVFRIRNERVTDLVRQRRAVDVGVSALFRNVENRPDRFIRAGTRNGVIRWFEVDFVLIQNSSFDAVEICDDFSSIDVDLREKTFAGVWYLWRFHFDMSELGKSQMFYNQNEMWLVK